MSRIGRQPIAVPDGVTVEVDEARVSVTGPGGALSQSVSPAMRVIVEGPEIRVERPSDEREHKSLHGLTRTLIANMVEGVTQGFQKVLEIQGVG